MNNFLLAGLTIFTFMLLFYLIARIIKNNSIVDIGWGLGFIITTVALLINSKNFNLRTVILMIMITTWGIRLTIHIFFRNRGKPEDFRYAGWRQSWGKKEPWIAFYKIFMLQGLLMWIISVPLIISFITPEQTLRSGDYIGVFLFIAGFLIEAVGDYQLKLFKKNHSNKGKIITTGLWKYTRHPNYFGEALLWWGIGIFAASAGIYLIALISPLVLTLLLRYVSGVPMLENKYRERIDFAGYARKTPVFIPFIGKKGLM
jgi:steroid 5-alpha reductase family enzyme